MVWGEISLIGKTKLVFLYKRNVNVASYVLQPHMIPTQRVGRDFILMLNNVCPLLSTNGIILNEAPKRVPEESPTYTVVRY